MRYPVLECLLRELVTRQLPLGVLEEAISRAEEQARGWVFLLARGMEQPHPIDPIVRDLDHAVESHGGGSGI